MRIREILFDRENKNNYMMFSFALYYLLLTIASVISTPESTTFNQVLIWGGSPLLMIIFFRDFSGSGAKLSSESIRLILFLLFVYQSRNYSDDLDLFDKAFRKVLLNILLFVVVEYFIFKTGEIKVFFIATLLGIAFLCAYILNAPPPEESNIDFEGFKIENESFNNNGLGNYAIEGILAFLFLWYNIKNRLIKYLTIGPLIIFIVTIIGAASKAGLIGFFIAVACWVLLCVSAATKDKFKLILFIAFLSIGMYFFTNYVLNNTYLGQRVNEVGKVDEYYENDSRGKLIQAGLDVFFDNPVMGAGLMQVAAKNEKGSYSHNEYVEVLANFGVVGALIYFPFILIIWRRLNTSLKVLKSDIRIVYNLNFMKVVIIVLLVRGISCPLFTSIDEMLLLAVAGGYSGYCASLKNTDYSFDHKLAS